MAPRRILIIDDDLDLCRELKESFRALGHRIDHVQDAIKGETLIRKRTYDTILLDFKMSLFSGMDLLKKLKGFNIRARIFIFSGKPLMEKALKEAGLRNMVSGIIAKPIDFEILLDTITKA